ncbi:HypC/HybG/HupF family hydrogenase formation chaperone [Halovenus sp. WSH3]|uniref:HypC/HybG/HupF family hydrogenase formation chaperone n=1 Tax=Halovenus carboxidivorans TaxID=2692199 RepID=A0A6B0T6V6_9EURY|nr:HypC/HybG/HupF family hydrogenase formation chaperone [Halovenus carboxidivorans]MXR52667.1 HypC/HybG/HupF family hydrogenase formation chaperone [Halovenus carboxidivorans]
MCLGIPGEIDEIDGTEALVDFGGAEKWVRVDIVGDQISPGDYVLTHAGFAIRKIPEHEVERTVELYEAAIEDDRTSLADRRTEPAAAAEPAHGGEQP